MKIKTTKPTIQPIAYADDELSRIAEDFATFAHPPQLRSRLGPRMFDFSVESLRHLELLLEDIRAVRLDGGPRNSALIDTGAYLGEVIRRASPAGSCHWITYKEALKLPDSSDALKGNFDGAMLLTAYDDLAFPFTKVCKRLDLGAEHSVLAFALYVIRVNKMAPGEREAFERAAKAAVGKGESG